MSNQRRRDLVKQIREEGRAAFLAGKSLQSNPHKYMDAQQWFIGWTDAEREAGTDED